MQSISNPLNAGVPVHYPGDPNCSKCKGRGRTSVCIPIDPASVPYPLSFMQRTYGRQVSVECECFTIKMATEFIGEKIVKAMMEKYRRDPKASPAHQVQGKSAYATGDWIPEVGIALGRLWKRREGRQPIWRHITDHDLIQIRFNGTEIVDDEGRARTTQNTEHLLIYDLLVLELGVWAEKNSSAGDKIATFLRDALAKGKVIWVVAESPLKKGDPVWSAALADTLGRLNRVHSATQQPSIKLGSTLKDDYVSSLALESPLDELPVPLQKEARA